MEYRTLGKSDIKVSELAFGAWAIGGWPVQETLPRYSKMLKQLISDSVLKRLPESMNLLQI
jgi:aryl-alcohol dehydrogenase-like predicted oxidoreductase